MEKLPKRTENRLLCHIYCFTLHRNPQLIYHMMVYKHGASLYMKV